MPKLNRTELFKVLGGWGAYIYTNFPAVRVLPARSEARELLAFFTVARASATDFKAAPPPWWGNMARTTGGGSVKGSPLCIQHKPISRPRCVPVRFCVSSCNYRPEFGGVIPRDRLTAVELRPRPRLGGGHWGEAGNAPRAANVCRSVSKI